MLSICKNGIEIEHVFIRNGHLLEEVGALSLDEEVQEMGMYRTLVSTHPRSHSRMTVNVGGSRANTMDSAACGEMIAKVMRKGGTRAFIRVMSRGLSISLLILFVCSIQRPIRSLY